MPEVTVAPARDPACRTPPTAPSLAHLCPRWPPARRRPPAAAGRRPPAAGRRRRH